jgi:hypothetical protein
MKTDYKNEIAGVKLSVPLLIRLLEYAREESPSDVDLHWVAERVIECSEHNYSLSMAHYTKLVPDERLVVVELQPGQKIEVEQIDE